MVAMHSTEHTFSYGRNIFIKYHFWPVYDSSLLISYPSNPYSLSKHRGPPVRDMPRHKLMMINLLIIATESAETVI